MSKRRLNQRPIATRHCPLLEPLEARALPSFLPPVNYPTGQYAHNVATGDFNGDDAVDLAVSNSEFGNGTTIGVRLNNGDGTFGTVKNFNGGSDVYWVIVGEFNNDGKDDIGVVNFGKVSVLLGNGNGTFQAPKSSTTSLHVVDMDAADLNADGNQDLVVSSAGTTPRLNVLLGNGNGTFKPFMTFRAGEKPWGVTIDDFDHDNIPDVVVANHMSLNSTISFLRGLGDGKFARPVSYLAFGRTTRQVASADFNDDGHLDVASANLGSGTVSIILGNGDGTFQIGKPHAVGLAASDLAVADFDGDGKPDVASVDYTFPLGNAVVLLGNGDGTLGAATKYPVGNSPFSLAAADLNGDILPDLAVVNTYSHNMSILINTPEPPLPMPGIPDNPQLATNNWELTTGDLQLATDNGRRTTDNCHNSGSTLLRGGPKKGYNLFGAIRPDRNPPWLALGQNLEEIGRYGESVSGDGSLPGMRCTLADFSSSDDHEPVSRFVARPRESL